VSRNREWITQIVEKFQGQELDPHYLGYFECFNQQLFYEAHEILEKVWLPQRKGADGPFYKGLIQLAGAFVHLQKNRPRPAGSLLKLAEANLGAYAPKHHDLDIKNTLKIVEEWLEHLESGAFLTNPLDSRAAPRLFLTP
jgi:predicted metal-dependent hydrolase